MKKIILLLLALCCVACQGQPTQNEPQNSEPSQEETLSLPEKAILDSSLASESPITSTNIDDYLFRDDCMYIDTRSPQQFLEEGHIAGFVNIPFYEALVGLKPTENLLYTTTTIRDENNKVKAIVGDVNSYTPNYEESKRIIESTFPKDKNLLIISTAGVESAYLINLLLQLGYDGSKLYNVGTFSNGMGDIVAYRTYKDAKYYVEGVYAYTVHPTYDYGELTWIQE